MVVIPANLYSERRREEQIGEEATKYDFSDMVYREKKGGWHTSDNEKKGGDSRNESSRPSSCDPKKRGISVKLLFRLYLPVVELHLVYLLESIVVLLAGAIVHLSIIYSTVLYRQRGREREGL